MRKSIAGWLIAAAVLVVGGCILFACTMAGLDWEFERLATAECETTTYEITETFTGLLVETDTTDILFALSEDGTCRVECYEEATAKHTVAVEAGTLTVRPEREEHLRGIVGFIGLNFDTPGITVFLPEQTYHSLLIRGNTCDVTLPQEFEFETVEISVDTGDVSVDASAAASMQIRATTGDIRVGAAAAGSMTLSATTGQIAVSGVTCEGDLNVRVTTGDVTVCDTVCRNLVTSGNTGDLQLRDVIAKEQFSIRRTTGDITMNDCDAAELQVETDTGDVVGSLLTDKIFVTRTNTGSVEVPGTTAGGRCEITTDTGDIRIDIP